MNINSRIKGLEKVQKVLGSLQGHQARTAYALALNDTGYQFLRPAVQAEMRAKFDRPTPFITKSPRVFPATPDKLSVQIMPTYASERGTTGGKQGVDPQHVLQAQEKGGYRADKRSEVALRRVGILPAGFQTVIPKDPFPGSADAFGNLRGGFLQQLLSYLQAFGEQGSKGNMKERAMANLHRGGTVNRLAKVHGPQLGRRYFIAGGRTVSAIEGGERLVTKRIGVSGTKHLAPGIWAAQGARGQSIRPVLLFVRGPAYSPRIDLDSLGETAEAQAYLSRKMRFRIRQAAGV